jgi:tetratricopeptide (TPR) repeat protein
MSNIIKRILVGFLVSAWAFAAHAADPDAALSRMRELLAQRQAKELIVEFGPVDFSAWPAGEMKKTVDALELRGRAYFIVKEGRRAEADLKQALGIDPKNIVVWLTRGENYLRNLEDEAQALTCFEEVTRITGASHGWQNLTAALFRAQILTDQVRADEALAELKRLDDPSNLPATWRIKVLRAYGHAYASQGNDSEALAQFREALRVESETKRAAAKP